MLATTKRTRQRTEGFDAIAKVLDNLLFAQLSGKQKHSLTGVSGTAYKLLSSLFSNSLKGVAKERHSSAAIATPTSTTVRPRRSLGNARPSPVPYRNEGTPPVSPTRLDQCLLPLTTVNRGMALGTGFIGPQKLDLIN